MPVRREPVRELLALLDSAASDPGSTDVLELEDQASQLLARALAAIRHAQVAAAEPAATERVRVGTLVGRAVRRLRTGAGLKQETLAADMRRIGFTEWARLTVTEVESGRRRVSYEELLGFAALFSVPIGEFLFGADDNELIELNEATAIKASTIAQLTELDTVDAVHALTFGPKSSQLLDAAGQSVCGVTKPTNDWRPAIAIRSRAAAHST